MLDLVNRSNPGQTVQKIGNCSYTSGNLQLVGNWASWQEQARACCCRSVVNWWPKRNHYTWQLLTLSASFCGIYSYCHCQITPSQPTPKESFKFERHLYSLTHLHLHTAASTYQLEKLGHKPLFLVNCPSDFSRLTCLSQFLVTVVFRYWADLCHSTQCWFACHALIKKHAAVKQFLILSSW